MSVLVAEIALVIALILASRLVVADRRNRDLAVRLAAAECAARTDDLTGLANRSGLQAAAALVQNSAAAGSYTAVILLDLDRFKPINDGHGHEVGDEVLRHVAGRIAGPAAGAACVARLGGDEFVVLLHPRASAGEAARHAHDRAAALCGGIREPIVVDALTLTVTISAGVAVLPTHRVDRLLSAADKAMYRAKRTANGICHYETRVDGPAPSRHDPTQDTDRRPEVPAQADGTCRGGSARAGVDPVRRAERARGADRARFARPASDVAS